MGIFTSGFGVLAQVADQGPGWEESGVAIAGIFLVTVVASMAIWQVFSTYRTRLATANAGEYRRLAEESTDLQKRLVDQQERLASDLSDLRSRVAGIEKTLQAID